MSLVYKRAEFLMLYYFKKKPTEKNCVRNKKVESLHCCLKCLNCCKNVCPIMVFKIYVIGVGGEWSMILSKYVILL